jgi:hypothetical protein
MATVSARATTAVAMDSRNVIRKLPSDGTTVVPTVTVPTLSTALTTAADMDIPIDRIKVLMPFAAAVSAGGTIFMIKAGMAL